MGSTRETPGDSPSLPALRDGPVRRGGPARGGLGSLCSMPGRGRGGARVRPGRTSVPRMRRQRAAPESLAAGIGREPLQIRGLVPLPELRESAPLARLPRRAAEASAVLRLPRPADPDARERPAQMPVRQSLGRPRIPSVDGASRAPALSSLRHDRPPARCRDRSRGADDADVDPPTLLPHRGNSGCLMNAEPHIFGAAFHQSRSSLRTTGLGRGGDMHGKGGAASCHGAEIGQHCEATLTPFPRLGR